MKSVRHTEPGSGTEAGAPAHVGPPDHALPGERAAPLSGWWTARQAAGYAQVGLKMVYREVGAHRLRAAKVGGRRELRFRPSWIDEWLESRATMVEVR